jgi:hypothetical protein
VREALAVAERDPAAVVAIVAEPDPLARAAELPQATIASAVASTTPSGASGTAAVRSGERPSIRAGPAVRRP